MLESGMCDGRFEAQSISNSKTYTGPARAAEWITEPLHSIGRTHVRSIRSRPRVKWRK